MNAGKGKASTINETSTISVETTEKKGGGTTKHFHGDASKVVLGGTGTKKGFMGRPTNFTVDVKNAGQWSLCSLLISCILYKWWLYLLLPSGGSSCSGSDLIHNHAKQH